MTAPKPAGGADCVVVPRETLELVKKALVLALRAEHRWPQNVCPCCVAADALSALERLLP